MNLIIVTPEIDHPQETDLINTFFSNGLLKLHLRKPFFTLSDYRNFLNRIDPKYHSRISVNGNFSLLNEFSGLGIHVTSQVREEAFFPKIIDLLEPSTISTSFHSWNEIEDNHYPFDYVFISPVFNSISKKGYKASIDLSRVKQVKLKIILKNEKPPSIIALGGVDATTIAVLYQNGFDGVAVLGAIWESENPTASFIKIKENIKAFEDA